MTTLAQLHLLSAAFLAGVGTATFIFSLIIGAVNDGKEQGCVLRILVLLLFGVALYLMLEGIRLGA